MSTVREARVNEKMVKHDVSKSKGDTHQLHFRACEASDLNALRKLNVRVLVLLTKT